MDNLLALNMIVGSGESEILKRCLESFDAKNTFDQIVIVQTAADEDVEKVIREYHGEETYMFSWESERYPYGNFGGARNLALRHTKCHFFMWLDTDDVASNNFLPSVEKLRELIIKTQMDVMTVPYNLIFDKDNKPTAVMDRERIVRVRPDIFWQYPVHEQLSIDGTKHRFVKLQKSFTIDHRPIKSDKVSSDRNLKILEHECSLTSDAHMQFYLARELWNSGQREQSVEIFKEFIDGRNGSKDSLAVACIKVAEYNLYDYEAEGTGQQYKTDTIDLAETYCRMSFAFNDDYAEPLVFLGDIYSLKENKVEAARFYKDALSKKFDGMGIQDRKFYTYVPAFRLCQLCAQVGQLEDSLLFSKKAIIGNPDPSNVHIIRKGIISRLQKEYED